MAAGTNERVRPGEPGADRARSSPTASCHSCRHAGHFDDIAILFCWVEPGRMQALPPRLICADYAPADGAVREPAPPAEGPAARE